MDSESRGTLEFPATHLTKIILSKDSGAGLPEIQSLLGGLGITSVDWSSKDDKTGKYVSWSGRLTFADRASFDQFYLGLKDIPGFKIAL